ncbi:MAG: carboxymuconolactone decarboxylase family protein [Chloroflexi bacterium]|nr:carboxymuconolactone decarboxylase family protein [Chloroflexota bacterium]
MTREELLAKIEALLEDPEVTTQALQELIQENYGAVGLVPRMLGRRPEAFIPAAIQSRALYHSPRAIDPKTAELAAVAASAALMCEHCLEAHMKAARRRGATLDEIMDVILVAGAIAESSTLSVAFHKFRQLEGNKNET